MVSHLKQTHGFTEHKVSHVELRLNSHRRLGLTEGRASQKAGSHRKQGLTEARASQKARSHRGSHRKARLHRRQGLAHYTMAGSHRRQVPSLVWLQACVSHMTQCGVSHSRQGNRGFAPEGVFTREITRSRTVALLYCSHTRTALAHFLFLVGGRMTGPALDILP